MFAEITPDALKVLESEHGDVFAVETKRGHVYFRRPKRVEIQRFGDSSHNKPLSAIMAANDQLSLSCAVHPDRDTLRTEFSTYPVLSAAIAGAIMAVAEGDETARAKAL